ncbi:hypothetical protein ABNG02_15785 [Halorubrum ejinorense]|uniref:Small CPxCG-related zinc finger protein n=1 Tax=Halorubrum ejinorense TaxID=425309 RepID=A0AAV3SRP5_9EURY
MRKPDFNGSSKELPSESDHLDESVYCVNCGNIFVWAPDRDCPTCTVAKMLDEAEGVTTDA